MNFDLMRLVAALLVVVSHTYPLSGQPPLRIMGVEDLGALGVSIFFVISGYLVTGSYQRDPRTYLVKRLLRCLLHETVSEKPRRHTKRQHAW